MMRSRWSWLFLPLFLGAMASLLAYPVGLFFLKSFAVNPPGKPAAWGLEGWIAAFVLGIGAALLGTLLYALVSYFIARTRFAGRGLVDLLSWLPWALPGVLISLALLWTVLGSGDLVRLIYGTIFLLILAIVIKEMPLGTQIIKAGVMQISHELEEASMTSGAPWLAGFRRILLPLLKPTLIAVGLIVFISAVRDIPTVIFLSTYESRTIALLMLDYMAGANMEKAAVLGVFLVLLIFLLMFVARLSGLRRVAVES